MNGDIVGLSIKVFYGHTFKTIFLNLFRGNKGVVNNNLHSKTPCPVCHNGADFSIAHNTQDLIENFSSLQQFFIPSSGFQGTRSPGDVPG